MAGQIGNFWMLALRNISKIRSRNPFRVILHSRVRVTALHIVQPSVRPSVHPFFLARFPILSLILDCSFSHHFLVIIAEEGSLRFGETRFGARLTIPIAVSRVNGRLCEEAILGHANAKKITVILVQNIQTFILMVIIRVNFFYEAHSLPPNVTSPCAGCSHIKM